MVQITVSDELARAIAEAGSTVTLVDSRGHAVGRIAPVEESAYPSDVSKVRWNEIQRRMQKPGTYISFKELKERLGW